MVTIKTRGVEIFFRSFLLFASPIVADTSRSVLSTALEPSMPSRGEEIFWCLKQLFSSQFCPKTANFNLSETKSLVFAIKRVFFFVYDQAIQQTKGMVGFGWFLINMTKSQPNPPLPIAPIDFGIRYV